MIDEALKNEPGPRMELSRKIAREIYERLGELEERSAQAGMVESYESAEKYEWCRLVAILLEAAFVKHEADLRS